MKGARLELRLDLELRQKVGELAERAGQPASVVVRRLILAAHRDAFGEARPSASCDTEVRRATAQPPIVPEPHDPWDYMTLEEVLETAGIYMGPDPQTDKPHESTNAPVTTTSTEAGP